MAGETNEVIPTSSLHKLELLDRDFLRRYTENHLLTVNLRMFVSIVPARLLLSSKDKLSVQRLNSDQHNSGDLQSPPLH